MGKDWTSITLTQATKDELEPYRENGESWDDFLNRVVIDTDRSEPPSTSRILEAIQAVPDTTAKAVEERLR